MTAINMKQIFILLLASGSLCFAQATPLQNSNGSSFAEPNFLIPENSEVNDYRPVLNAEATTVIFERNFTATPDDIKLYSLDLATGDVQPFVNFASTRPDWCWHRSGRGLTSGPVAFSNGDGIYRLDPGGQSVLLPNTTGMIYPSWYPDCQKLAVDVTGTQVTAEIDAMSGQITRSPLANERVWAGFPSVKQTSPNLVAFAGQANRDSNYYNQDLNYVWVTDTSTARPRVAPLDRRAPREAAFLQKFQARAGWWSPDGRWFAFESNRSCDDINGQTYAIFIQDATGNTPAMQVTDCSKWNVQHPKWFPPTQDGKIFLIAAVQAIEPNQPPCPPPPFRIASFDVTQFVSER
jgi:WD40-like Beta Propeller Repeat